MRQAKVKLEKDLAKEESAEEEEDVKPKKTKAKRMDQAALDAIIKKADAEYELNKKERKAQKYDLHCSCVQRLTHLQV